MEIVCHALRTEVVRNATYSFVMTTCQTIAIDYDEEMKNTLHDALEKAGVTPAEIAQVEQLLQSEELRRKEWTKTLGTQEGTTANKIALEVWNRGTNSSFENSTKTDITADLQGLPNLPSDARFEEEKRKNQAQLDEKRKRTEKFMKQRQQERFERVSP